MILALNRLRKAARSCGNLDPLALDLSPQPSVFFGYLGERALDGQKAMPSVVDVSLVTLERRVGRGRQQCEEVVDCCVKELC